MPAFQFESHLGANLSVPIPPDIARQLKPNEPVRVVLLTGEDEKADAEWNALAAEQFLKGYAPGDDIYDQLSAG